MSPLKRSSTAYDHSQFCAEELQKQMMQQSMKAYYKQELGKQMAHNETMKQKGNQDNQDLRRTASADVARMMKQQAFEQGVREKDRQTVRAALDEQVTESNRRAQENRQREAHEAAETKLRVLQQLNQELGEQGRKKEARNKELQQHMRDMEAKANQKSNDRELENASVRRAIQEAHLQEEYRLAAQQERLKAAQSNLDKSGEFWLATAGKDQKDRIAREEARHERDEKQMTMLTDLHYARREDARERQRIRMCKTLHDQRDASRRKKVMQGVQKDMEREAMNENSRKVLDQELQRFNKRRNEERENQSVLIQMMAAKQQREKSDGIKPQPSVATMQITPGLMAMTTGSIPKPSAHDHTQRVDASKFLTKPLGRPEVKPWIDIERSHGLGGLVGVFGGEGATKSTLVSTGGNGRIMTKALDLAVRDHQLESHWHKGLSAADRKTGLAAAARRGAVKAADVSNTS